MKLKNLALIAAMTMGTATLMGCNDSSQSSSQSSVQQPKQQTVEKEVKKAPVVEEKSFAYTWLNGIETQSLLPESERSVKNYMIVYDASGSMDRSSCESSEYKSKIAYKAVIDYVQSLETDKNVGLVVFDNNGISIKSELSKDRQSFINGLNSIVVGSGTPLHTAMKLGYGELRKEGFIQNGEGEYNLIVITDGESNTGEDPTGIVKEIVHNSPVNISTIGFCIGAKHSLKNPQYVNYYSASNYEQIMKSLKSVDAEGESLTEADMLKEISSM